MLWNGLHDGFATVRGGAAIHRVLHAADLAGRLRLQMQRDSALPVLISATLRRMLTMCCCSIYDPRWMFVVCSYLIGDRWTDLLM